MARGYTYDGQYVKFPKGYYVFFTEEEVADMVPSDFGQSEVPSICDELIAYWQDNMEEHIKDIIDWCY